MELDSSYHDDDFDEEFEFDECNESNWSDNDHDIHLDSGNLTDSCVSMNDRLLTTKSLASPQSLTRTPSIQYWSCLQCNQLNNLKDTLSKYDMKCFRCENLYDIKTEIIELNNDPIEQTVWKCSTCTYCNPLNIIQCEICGSQRPVDENDQYMADENEHVDENQELCAFNRKYRDEYSTTLVCGYLRAICNLYLDLNQTSNLCPFDSTLPDALSIVVLQFYQFCNFWNMEYVLRDWKFDKEFDDDGKCVDNKSTLILKTIEHEWRNAFSLQRVEYLGDYSWTLQIQNVFEDCNTVDKDLRCWIGVIESKHDSALELRSRNNELFCATSFGYGVYGCDGSKMNNEISKPFGYPFKINDIITIKLQCTRGYYELLYFVNGENMGIKDDIIEEEQGIGRQNVSNVAYRLPTDKVYEMVIALESVMYKIKCISFETKPYMLL